MMMSWHVFALSLMKTLTVPPIDVALGDAGKERPWMAVVLR